MKIKFANFIGKSCVLIMALGLGAKIQAATIDLVLTEVDDNTLLASGTDGANWTIVGSGDQWSATRSAPLPGMGNNFVFASWTEPDDARYLNSLEMSYFTGEVIGQIASALSTPFGFFLSSDQLATTDDSPVANGTPVLFTFFDANGGQTIPYVVQFIDLGDTPQSVPDRASTALCFVFGLASLLWFKRNHALDQ